MKNRPFLVAWALAAGGMILFSGLGQAQAVKDDPLLFMPGSQPGSLSKPIEPASNCQSCHGGYAPAIEPGDTWTGSMMAQAARDPLWLACTVVANQDSIWALGTHNAADLCLRCHTPGGWLGGRSDPPNLSLLTITDYDGVSCDSCHRMVDAMSALGQPDVPAETVAAGITAAATTSASDWNNLLRYLQNFDGTLFYDTGTKLPKTHGAWPAYNEATSGQFLVLASDAVKRGPRWDSEPKSKTVEYSRFHKSRTMCATCHDVSNPVLANLTEAGATGKYAAGSYFHVERTWSEFQSSAYARSGGASTTAAYASATGITHAASCQDCHMPKAVGKAANKNVAVRADLAVHDLAGGNTWITRLLATADTKGSVYNAYNHSILSGTKYPGAKIEITGLQGKSAQLLAGEARARKNLRSAATLELLGDAGSNIRMRIRNNTGHKLISGFPEGRRMWLNVQFLDAQGAIVSEINPYSPLVTSLSGGNRVYESGGLLAVHREDLVYETKMSSSLTGEQKTFHFVLATGRYKDNRIPPVGFDTSIASTRLAMPCWQGQDAPEYFTAAEYAGGYDEIDIPKPPGVAGWRAHLYYQTTSKEYIDFLHDEIMGLNKTLAEPAPSGVPTAYQAQTDAYYQSLKDWGKAIRDLWLNNGGSPPELMATAISPAVIAEAGKHSSGYIIRFATLPGRRYQPQVSLALSPGGWTNLGAPITGDGTVVEVTDTTANGQPRGFYRIESSLITP
jgi:hypothetical protein